MNFKPGKIYNTANGRAVRIERCSANFMGDLHCLGSDGRWRDDKNGRVLGADLFDLHDSDLAVPSARLGAWASITLALDGLVDSWSNKSYPEVQPTWDRRISARSKLEAIILGLIHRIEPETEAPASAPEIDRVTASVRDQHETLSGTPAVFRKRVCLQYPAPVPAFKSTSWLDRK